MDQAVDHSRTDLEAIETAAFLEAVNQAYGYDFREYASASLRRRLHAAMVSEHVETISALQDQVLRDPECMERFLRTVTINVTSMFRDPSFFLALRGKVVPVLRTYPFIRVWIAGCASGEEVYSLAILLHEEGLYERTRIYATDLSVGVLKSAQDGIFPLEKMKEYTRNYQQAGGSSDFSDYYAARYDSAIVKNDLKRNLVFSQHNLVTGNSFNEFHLIMCRNVMIYFNKRLQGRVLTMFHESQCTFGLLALGMRESLRFSAVDGLYQEFDAEERLYRRLQ
jgi:chemotaxis protein methyltransferase CheR